MRLNKDNYVQLGNEEKEKRKKRVRQKKSGKLERKRDKKLRKINEKLYKNIIQTNKHKLYMKFKVKLTIP